MLSTSEVPSGTSEACRVVVLELDTLGNGVISLLMANIPSNEEKTRRLWRCSVVESLRGRGFCFGKLLRLCGIGTESCRESFGPGLWCGFCENTDFCEQLLIDRGLSRALSSFINIFILVELSSDVML